MIICNIFSLQAAQTDDRLKTADAVVSVTIEDVNDNPPEFDQPSYSVTLLENSLVDAVVFKAIVTDLDQVGFASNYSTKCSNNFEVISSIICFPREDLWEHCGSFQNLLLSPSVLKGRSELRTQQLWTERPLKTSHFR